VHEYTAKIHNGKVRTDAFRSVIRSRDTSALIAPLRGEPDAPRFADALATRAEPKRLSPANYIEAAIVIPFEDRLGWSHAGFGGEGSGKMARAHRSAPDQAIDRETLGQSLTGPCQPALSNAENCDCRTGHGPSSAGHDPQADEAAGQNSRAAVSNMAIGPAASSS
jgi:hypothetical protein